MNEQDRLAGADVMKIGVDAAGSHHATDFYVCIRHLRDSRCGATQQSAGGSALPPIAAMWLHE